MSGALGQKNTRFDFRRSVEGRERAIRTLEILLRKADESGQEVDPVLLIELQNVITGRIPAPIQPIEIGA